MHLLHPFNSFLEITPQRTEGYCRKCLHVKVNKSQFEPGTASCTASRRITLEKSFPLSKTQLAHLQNKANSIHIIKALRRFTEISLLEDRHKVYLSARHKRNLGKSYLTCHFQDMVFFQAKGIVYQSGFPHEIFVRLM